ncbi:LOW QUALITY PROTEIN: protein BNIP5 [Fukomys damarensis]|uniref:LOW QUALITY PROTEIN: protein BNIP5 n=1 Tax=Fukomys damarensis TaxID=885580 RepID=UPI001455A6B1|nr:LOW QUALITY PROTEIN: protein BNIP5 [Fukomys damarensis]
MKHSERSDQMEKPGDPRRAQSLDRSHTPRKDSESTGCQCLSLPGTPCRKAPRRAISDGAGCAQSPSPSSGAQGTGAAAAHTLEEMRGFVLSEQRHPPDTKKDKAQRQAQQGWLKTMLNFFLRTGFEEPKDKASRRPKGKEEPPQPPEAAEELVLRKKAQDKKTGHKKCGHRKHGAEEAKGNHHRDAGGHRARLPKMAAASHSEEAEGGPVCRGEQTGSPWGDAPSQPEGQGAPDRGKVTSGGLRLKQSSTSAQCARPNTWRSHCPVAVWLGLGALTQLRQCTFPGEYEQVAAPRSLGSRAIWSPAPSQPTSRVLGEGPSRTEDTELCPAAELANWPGQCLWRLNSVLLSRADGQAEECRPDTHTPPPCVPGGLDPSSAGARAGLSNVSPQAQATGPRPEEEPRTPDQEAVIQMTVELLKKVGDQWEDELQAPQPEALLQNPAPACRRKSQEKMPGRVKRAFSLKKCGPEEPRRARAAHVPSPEARPPKRPSFLPLCIRGPWLSTSSSPGELGLAVAIATLHSLAPSGRGLDWPHSARRRAGDLPTLSLRPGRPRGIVGTVIRSPSHPTPQHPRPCPTGVRGPLSPFPATLPRPVVLTAVLGSRFLSHLPHEAAEAWGGGGARAGEKGSQGEVVLARGHDVQGRGPGARRGTGTCSSPAGGPHRDCRLSGGEVGTLTSPAMQQGLGVVQSRCPPQSGPPRGHTQSSFCSPGSEGPGAHEALSADGDGPRPLELPTCTRCQGPEEGLLLDRASEPNDFMQKILALLQGAEEPEGQQTLVQETEAAGESLALACKKKSQEKKPSSLRRAFSHKRHSSKEPRRAETVGAATPEPRPSKRSSFLPLCVGGPGEQVWGYRGDGLPILLPVSAPAEWLGAASDHTVMEAAWHLWSVCCTPLSHGGVIGPVLSPWGLAPRSPTPPTDGGSEAGAVLAVAHIGAFAPDAEGLELQEHSATEGTTPGFSEAASQARSCTPDGEPQPERAHESKELVICKLVALLQEEDGELGRQIQRHPSLKRCFEEFSDSSLWRLVATLRSRKAGPLDGDGSLLPKRIFPFALGVGSKYAEGHSRTICSLMGSRGHYGQHGGAQCPSKEAQPVREGGKGGGIVALGSAENLWDSIETPLPH